MTGKTVWREKWIKRLIFIAFAGAFLSIMPIFLACFGLIEYVTAAMIMVIGALWFGLCFASTNFFDTWDGID